MRQTAHVLQRAVRHKETCACNVAIRSQPTSDAAAELQGAALSDWPASGDAALDDGPGPQPPDLGSGEAELGRGTGLLLPCMQSGVRYQVMHTGSEHARGCAYARQR